MTRESPAPVDIPLSVPHIAGREQEYVEQCLHTGWVSSTGSFVDRFESALASRAGRSFGVATINGTSALHLALLAAGVGRGEEVIVPALTFIAPANAVHYVGANPVFIDVEPDFWQLDVGLVEQFLRESCVHRADGVFSKRSGSKVSAIIPVHILGHAVDMAPLLTLAGEFGLAVIEDAAESLGATYDGKPVGGLGDIGCFSFNGNKIVTAGGGGMLVTDNADWARRAKHLSTQSKWDPLEYVHDEIGYNYRLTNIQAAVGCAQLEQLDRFVDAKRKIAEIYNQGFCGVEQIRTMREASSVFSTFWLYTVLINSPGGMDRRSIMRELQARGIQSRPLWQPLHLSPAYAGEADYFCPVAASLYECALSLPSSVGLAQSPASLDRVISVVLDCVQG